MSHFNDAVKLLTMADESAIRGMQAAAESDDPLASLPGMVGAAMHLLAAQVHATLAVADATRAARQVTG